MKQQFSTASNYSEACDMLRSGYVKHVRLNWNIGSDEFFRIASDWCDTGAKIKKASALATATMAVSLASPESS